MEKFYGVATPHTIKHHRESRAVAEARAREIMEGDPRCNELVIFEAVAVVRRATPPIEVVDLPERRLCSRCGTSIEATRPRSKTCRRCDR